MRAGTVIRWDHFPNPRLDNEIKARWFVVYLGKTSSFESPVFFHFSATTTQADDFKIGGKRAGHQFCLLKATDTPFEQDCIIDLYEAPWPLTEDQLTGNPDIEFKGEISAECLKKIYDLLLKSSVFSKKIILHIHRALNDVAITGLKKPK